MRFGTKLSRWRLRQRRYPEHAPNRTDPFERHVRPPGPHRKRGPKLHRDLYRPRQADRNRRPEALSPVSYTHLDVYKRQDRRRDADDRLCRSLDARRSIRLTRRQTHSPILCPDRPRKLRRTAPQSTGPDQSGLQRRRLPHQVDASTNCLLYTSSRSTRRAARANRLTLPRASPAASYRGSRNTSTSPSRSASTIKSRCRDSMRARWKTSAWCCSVRTCC